MQSDKSLKLIGLTLGNPWDKKSWSGSNYPFFSALRNRNVLAAVYDVDSYGLKRNLRIIQSFSPVMKTWRLKFHLNTNIRNDRSQIARQLINEYKQDVSGIIQIGSEFGICRYDDLKKIPKFAYHDSNLQFYLKSPIKLPNIHRDNIQRALEYERNHYNGMDLIFTMSDFLRDSFINDFQLPREKVHTVGAGCNLDFIEDIKKEYDEPIMLFVAKHKFEQKGGNVVIEAFKKIKKEIPRSRLLIVGMDLNIQIDGVETIGYINKNDASGYGNLKNIYKRASLFIMPSYYDAFGIVFLEAMAHKIPCIGADCCAMPEIIVSSNAGYVIRPGDSDELAKKVIFLFKNPELMRLMGSNGYNAIKSKYSWDIVIDKIVDKISSKLS